jgi:hypothetical protein
MFKKAVRRGSSEVHGAKHNERPVCGRRRDGEAAVSWKRIVTFLPAHPEPAETGSVPKPYGEPLSDARTTLADFFNSLPRLP